MESCLQLDVFLKISQVELLKKPRYMAGKQSIYPSWGKESVKVINWLPVAKIGRPLLLGEDLDKKVQNYLFSLRNVGGVINTAIVQAAAAGMVKRKDPRLLGSYGGHISFSKDWARHMLQRIGFVKRKGTTKAKSQVDNFDKLKYQFYLNTSFYLTSK